MASWLEQSWVTSSGLRNDYEGWIARYMNSGTYDQYGATYSTQYGMYQYTDKLVLNTNSTIFPLQFSLTTLLVFHLEQHQKETQVQDYIWDMQVHSVVLV